MSAGETIHTSSTGGQKAGNNVRASLFPWHELMEAAELFGKGALKYDDHNWRKGYPWHLSFDALHRHLAAWWEGEEFDNGEGGTGQEHLDCVIFHALVLKWFRKHRPEFDDRYVTVSKQAEARVTNTLLPKHRDGKFRDSNGRILHYDGTRGEGWGRNGWFDDNGEWRGTQPFVAAPFTEVFDKT